MNRKTKLTIQGLLLLPVLTAGALAVAVVVRQDRKFDRPYPDLHASTDPTVVARGRYLVEGPAHCGACHSADLGGGLAFHLPVGVVYAPNITPDPATGIFRVSDPAIARVLRHGVSPDGRALLPFMPFAHLSDADLIAVLSYLRSVPPVSRAVPRATRTLLGRFAYAFLLEPTGPSRPVPAAMQPEPTAAYGRYLAHDVANCAGCHTRRDLRTGEPSGPVLAGGMMLPSHDLPGASFLSPNLTPDPETGHLRGWSEDAFVQRFRAGPQMLGSPMPWQSYATMTDNDLRALYRYLRTVEPARRPS